MWTISVVLAAVIAFAVATAVRCKALGPTEEQTADHAEFYAAFHGAKRDDTKGEES